MQAKFNPDPILDLILESLVEYDNWLRFRQLANRLTGDHPNDQLIARIGHRHSRVLVVTDGCRCKLRTGSIEDAAIASRRQSPNHLRIFQLSSWLVMILLLPACNALNPLCGSARPAPSLNSISPTTMVFSQLPPSFVITATGSNFVSSSVLVFNGATLATSVISSSQLTANITSSMIPGPGIFEVVVQTPAGNTGDLGCSSGGTTSAQILTVN